MPSFSDIFASVKLELDKGEEDKLRKKIGKIDTKDAGSQVASRFGVGFNGAIGSVVSRSAGIFAAGFAAVKVGGFLKGAITEASNLGETMSKSAAVFGPANKIITDFASTSAEKLGQTEQQATAAAAQFGNMFNQLGIGQKTAATMSTQMVTLASDFASFHNADITEVLTAQEAAFRGEYDSIQKFVPTLNAAAVEQEGLRLKLAGSTKELTQQDKALATQSLMMSGAGKAAGDFGRTSGGLANQQRILTASFGDFKTSVGAVALPLVTKFFGFLNSTAMPAVRGLFALFKDGDFSGELRKAFNVEEDSAFVGFLFRVRDTAVTVFTEVRSGITAFAAAWKYNDGEVTSSGLPGFMERLGYVARQAFGFFGSEVLPRLREFAGFVTGTVIPSIGNLVTAFRPVVTDATNTAVSVGEKLLPALRDMASFITGSVGPALSGFTTFLRNNSTLVGAVATGVGAIVASMYAYRLALTVVSGAAKAYAAVQAALNLVMSLNPISVVVLALAGLAAGLVYAYKNSETFRDIVNGVFTAVRDFAVGAFAKITAAVSGAIEWVKKNWPLILGIITGPVGLAVVAVGKYWETIESTAGTLIEGIKTTFTDGFKFVVDKFLGLIQSVLDGAAKAFGWVPALKDKLAGAAGDFAAFRDDVNNKLAGIKDQDVKIKTSFSPVGILTPAGSQAAAAAKAASQRFGFVTRATGGAVFGPGTPTSDSIPALLSNNEHVWTAKEVAAAGGHGAVEAMRSAVLKRAKGGPVTFDLAAQFGSPAQEAARIASTTHSLAQSYGRSLQTLADAASRKLAAEQSDMGGGPINAGLAGVLSWARSQVGKPYIWGGVGPRGYDCSGAVSAAINTAFGRNPHSRLGATGSMPWSMFAPGPGAFQVGWFKGNPGHTAATVNGVNIESRGGRGFVMGSAARGASDRLFTNRMHVKGFAQGGAVFKGDPAFDLLDPRGEAFAGPDFARALGIKTYDTGGMLPPGGAGINRGSRPEAVLNAEETADFKALVAGLKGGRSGPVHLTVVDRNGELIARMEGIVDDKNRSDAISFNL